jgi:hypothetical protein
MIHMSLILKQFSLFSVCLFVLFLSACASKSVYHLNHEQIRQIATVAIQEGNPELKSEGLMFSGISLKSTSIDPTNDVLTVSYKHEISLQEYQEQNKSKCAGPMCDFLKEKEGAITYYKTFNIELDKTGKVKSNTTGVGFSSVQ